MNPFRFVALMVLWPFERGIWWSEKRLKEGGDNNHLSHLAREKGMPGILNNGKFEHELKEAQIVAGFEIILATLLIVIPIAIRIIKIWIQIVELLPHIILKL